jgi:glucan endo-1,3-alpha-glucosidase
MQKYQTPMESLSESLRMIRNCYAPSKPRPSPLLKGILYFVIFSCAAAAAAAPKISTSKLVVAHYMVCCSQQGALPSISEYESEIKQATFFGIDAFALNVGNWDRDNYKEKVRRIYVAAANINPKFRLFVSMDDKAIPEWASIADFSEHQSNNLTIDGKVVIASYGGQRATGEPGESLATSLKKRGLYYIPYYVPLSRPSEWPTNAQINDLVDFFQPVPAFHYFGASGTEAQIIRINTAYRLSTSSNNKLFMAGVSPYYRGRPPRNARAFDRNGFEGMRNIWLSLIADNADMVEIATWNDWFESTYIQPCHDSNCKLVQEFGYGKVYDHAGFSYALRPYIEIFKGRDWKENIPEGMEYFYFPRTAKITHATVNKIAPHLGSLGISESSIETLFLSRNIESPVDIKIESKNGGSKMINIPAGLGVSTIRLDSDDISMTIMRTGHAIQQVIFVEGDGNYIDDMNYASGHIDIPSSWPAPKNP